MKTEKEFVVWIREQVNFYHPILGLHLHTTEIEKAKNWDDDFSMEITCTYPYYDAVIRYTKQGFERWQLGKMAKNRVLHELLHIITDPLYVKATMRYTSRNEIEDERERLTDILTVIIRNLVKNV